MWKEFDGSARNREQTLERINALKWTDWRPQGITLHNTAAPTLAQWAESGPAHDARIRNLQSFYEHELGWHAGPHWFVSRNWINWFSNPLLPGVHSRCFNATRFGIEMVGDYNSEEFDSGDGALVRDNAVFLIAALNRKFGFDPDDLKFHVECTRDNHDCPGKKVVKADVISRVKAMMNVLKLDGAGIQHPEFFGTTHSATSPKRFLNITATEFGGEGDEQPVAYSDVPRGWPRHPGVALPARFSGARPKVRVFKGNNSVLCDIVDVGPWYPSARGPADKYWETGGRPRAESDGRTNRAGIDLTPAAAAAIALDGKGIVDWEFVGTTQAQMEEHEFENTGIFPPQLRQQALTHNSLQLLTLVLLLLSNEKPMASDPAETGQGFDHVSLLLPLLLQSAFTGKEINTEELLTILLTGKPFASQAPIPAPSPQPLSHSSPQLLADLNAMVLPLLYERLTGKPWPGTTTAAPQKKPDTPNTPAQPATSRPSVQLSAAGLGVTSILQALGIIGTPFGMGQSPTEIGTLATLIPVVTGVFGATGGFGGLLNAGRMLLGGLAGAAGKPK